MRAIQPLDRIPVGVIVERRRTLSAWLDFVWRPTGVLAGLPDVDPWTALSADPDVTLFYGGGSEIELYRSETDNYRSNLLSAAPSLWVAMYPTAGAPPYRLIAVTADPAEGESLTEPGTAIVEAVPMPEMIQRMIAAFVAEHHVERPFEKRIRDRADPEALARHGRRGKNDHE